MKKFGIEFNYNDIPALDREFIPFYVWEKAFLSGANEKIAVSLERNRGKIAVLDTFIHGTDEYYEADCFYIERKIKFLLWSKGGYKITIFGNKKIFDFIKKTYSAEGERHFDFVTMGNIYELPFEVQNRPYEEKVAEIDSSVKIGGHTDGCRIGFDAGGSDRKVSAVIDGKVVYSEEVVWHPKTQTDPSYHYNGIVEALKTAASKMPRVDAIGISSAGIFIDNRAMLCSLFVKLSPEDFDKYAKDTFIRAGKSLGENIPFEIANDGDVTALEGAIRLNDNSVLGIAMGTSEAGGYVDKNGNITGWLNEFAFMPVDLSENGAEDEWSGDKGCGVKYFSQDAVIKLCPKVGIELDPSLSPAEKLKVVQKLANDGDKNALDIFRTIGSYLGHTIPLYASNYEVKHFLLLGRVASGKGGELLIEECKRVLTDNYPEFKINIVLPDETSRRVGQSVAAAGLAEIK